MPAVVAKIWIRPGAGRVARGKFGYTQRGTFVSMQQKDKFTPELRILAASLLSMAVILLWAKFFGPKPPVPQPRAAKPGISAPSPADGGKPDAHITAAAGHSTPGAISAVPAAPVSAKSDAEERTVVIENDLYRVELSNRGAVVKSWQLRKYTDDAKPPRILDVVHPLAAQQIGSWPFALVLDDPEAQTAANAGLYQMSSAAEVVSPTDVDFSWSDG